MEANFRRSSSVVVRNLYRQVLYNAEAWERCNGIGDYDSSGDNNSDLDLKWPEEWILPVLPQISEREKRRSSSKASKNCNLSHALLWTLATVESPGSLVEPMFNVCFSAEYYSFTLTIPSTSVFTHSGFAIFFQIVLRWEMHLSGLGAFNLLFNTWLGLILLHINIWWESCMFNMWLGPLNTWLGFLHWRLADCFLKAAHSTSSFSSSWCYFCSSPAGIISWWASLLNKRFIFETFLETSPIIDCLSRKGSSEKVFWLPCHRNASRVVIAPDTVMRSCSMRGRGK